MTFDEFIQTAWNDHAARPQDVADRVAASLPIIETPTQIPPFVRLVTHVYGEHLGQWGRGIEILDSLRRIPAYDGSALVTEIVARNIAVFALCRAVIAPYSNCSPARIASRCSRLHHPRSQVKANSSKPSRPMPSRYNSPGQDYPRNARRSAHWRLAVTIWRQRLK